MDSIPRPEPSILKVLSTLPEAHSAGVVFLPLGGPPPSQLSSAQMSMRTLDALDHAVNASSNGALSEQQIFLAKCAVDGLRDGQLERLPPARPDMHSIRFGRQLMAPNGIAFLACHVYQNELGNYDIFHIELQDTGGRHPLLSFSLLPAPGSSAAPMHVLPLPSHEPIADGNKANQLSRTYLDEFIKHALDASGIPKPRAQASKAMGDAGFAVTPAHLLTLRNEYRKNFPRRRKMKPNVPEVVLHEVLMAPNRGKTKTAEELVQDVNALGFSVRNSRMKAKLLEIGRPPSKRVAIEDLALERALREGMANAKSSRTIMKEIRAAGAGIGEARFYRAKAKLNADK